MRWLLHHFHRRSCINSDYALIYALWVVNKCELKPIKVACRQLLRFLRRIWLIKCEAVESSGWVFDLALYIYNYIYIRPTLQLQAIVVYPKLCSVRSCKVSLVLCRPRVVHLTVLASLLFCFYWYFSWCFDTPILSLFFSTELK